jgi:HAD superfamily hydrolase (TIGR01509 family)
MLFSWIYFNEGGFMIKKCLIAALTAYTTLTAAPQAIVFDFGGVLTGAPNREVVVQFIRKSFGFSAEEFEHVNQQKRKAVAKGKTDDEFWLGYAKRHGIELPATWSEDFKKVSKEALGVNESMFGFVDHLKQEGYTVGLLSNIDARLAGFVRWMGLYEPFEPCLLSYQIGFEKPDVRIFEYLVQTLKLPAEDIVFIDDNPENVAAAKQVGLDAILFTSQEDLEKALKVGM